MTSYAGGDEEDDLVSQTLSSHQFPPLASLIKLCKYLSQTLALNSVYIIHHQSPMMAQYSSVTMAQGGQASHTRHSPRR